MSETIASLQSSVDWERALLRAIYRDFVDPEPAAYPSSSDIVLAVREALANALVQRSLACGTIEEPVEVRERIEPLVERARKAVSRIDRARSAESWRDRYKEDVPPLLDALRSFLAERGRVRRALRIIVDRIDQQTLQFGHSPECEHPVERRAAEGTWCRACGALYDRERHEWREPEVRP